MEPPCLTDAKYGFWVWKWVVAQYVKTRVKLTEYFLFSRASTSWRVVARSGWLTEVRGQILLASVADFTISDCLCIGNRLKNGCFRIWELQQLANKFSIWMSPKWEDCIRFSSWTFWKVGKWKRSRLWKMMFRLNMRISVGNSIYHLPFHSFEMLWESYIELLLQWLSTWPSTS